MCSKSLPPGPNTSLHKCKGRNKGVAYSQGKIKSQVSIQHCSNIVTPICSGRPDKELQIFTPTLLFCPVCVASVTCNFSIRCETSVICPKATPASLSLLAGESTVVASILVRRDRIWSHKSPRYCQLLTYCNPRRRQLMAHKIIICTVLGPVMWDSEANKVSSPKSDGTLVKPCSQYSRNTSYEQSLGQGWQCSAALPCKSSNQ